MCHINLLHDTATHSLKIQYESRNEKVFFDLCDEGGRVIASGKLDNGVATVSTKVLGKGVYTVFIVDGMNLKRENFMQPG